MDTLAEAELEASIGEGQVQLPGFCEAPGTVAVLFPHGSAHTAGLVIHET